MGSSKFWKSENGMRIEPVTVCRPGRRGTDEQPRPAYLFCDFFDEILTRCSPRDCQMSFGIGQGFAEVQIIIIFIQTTKLMNERLRLQNIGNERKY